MNMLCRIGWHRWRLVQRWSSEGVESSFFGCPCVIHWVYQGERCCCCGERRKEGAMRWWQPLGWLMFLAPLGSLITWAGAWGVVALTLSVLVVAGIVISGLTLALME
jgi:hypothetical protein